MSADFARTILCAVDFSELSAFALRQASILAARSGARVLAIYAARFDPPPYFTEARLTELLDEFRRSMEDARRHLETFIASVLDSRSVEVEPRIVEGRPADAIREEAARAGAELVVMGTHGRSGVNRWMLGSVAERVLRESVIPVLTVRGEPVLEIRRILCPVDDSEASRGALLRASALGEQFGASVTALHVQEPHGAVIPNLCAWIPAEARKRGSVTEMVLHGSAAEEIVRLTSTGDYDLLVLGAPRRRFFQGMVLGTTAIRAVRPAACPVLSVPAGEFPRTSEKGES